MPMLGHEGAAEFVRRYWPAGGDQPKHEKLRQAFTASIIDGYWPPGARLPTEAELVSSTPCSLGTVQRALRALVDDGVIKRRRGSGSIVADLSEPIEEPWHMRFLDKSGGESRYLPVFTHVLERLVSREKGPWSTAIDQGDRAIMKIDRIFAINDEIKAYAIFYAVAERFPELVELPDTALNGKNFKIFIARRYHVPVHKVRQKVRFEVPNEKIASNSDCVPGQPAMVLNVLAHTLSGEPIYYQDFYVPATRYELDLGTAPR